MKNDLQRQLAFHCAGHVVGSWLNKPIAGRDNQGVAWIETEDATCGITGMHNSVRTNRADAVVALCGPVAERLSRGLAVTGLIANPQTRELRSASPWLEDEDGEDVRFVEEAIARLGFPQDLDVFRKLQSEARAILSNAQAWSAVERIAEILEKDGQLDMEAAHVIVDSAFHC